MGKFITGVKEKYPEEILESREMVEGNCIFSFWKNPSLFHEYKELDSSHFLTEDGRFYFTLGRDLSKLYNVFDEVAILSHIADNEILMNGFNERGGFDVIHNGTLLINAENMEQYIDVLNRENIIIKLYDEGFNLLKPIDINGKEIIPLKLIRRMSAAETLQFYEARLSNLGIRVKSNDMEIRDLGIEDGFIEELESGSMMGIPFDIGGVSHTTGEVIKSSKILSNISLGINKGELTLIGGFSGSGKTSLTFANFIMPMVYRGEKVCITANEQRLVAWQILLLIYTLVHHFNYYNLNRKKLKAGNFTDKDKQMMRNAIKYINAHYKDKIKFIKTFDYDVKTIVREQKRLHLNEGYTVFVYDTFKAQDSTDLSAARGSMVEDSKLLFQFASKYNVPQIITAQLATYLEKTSWVTANCLASSKQTKEVCSEIFLMRKVVNSMELDPKSKYYMNPYKLVKKNDKWVKEPFEVDYGDNQYRIIFVDKTRNDEDSAAILYKYDGHINVWHELGHCTPSRINFLN